MDKAHPLSTPMVIRSLDVKKKTHLVLVKRVKNNLVLKYHIIGALMYLANCTHPDIVFFLSIY